jgi:hypothetical protein
VIKIYVDELARSGAPGSYRGKDAGQAKRVGARHGHQWCHLFADEADCEELHAFARRLGMKRDWFQGDHYDLVPTKRVLGVRLGAVELDRAAAVAIWRKQREAK